MDIGNCYQKNALELAYVGDAVFSLMVREYLVNNYNSSLSVLNKKANAVVCAPNQARIMQEIEANLTNQEKDIAMRARNSHTNNKAKNSTFAQYHLATEFEAVIGFWYLTKNNKKLEEIFKNYVVGEL